MTEEKVGSLKIRIRTIRNMAATAETRELCDVASELLRIIVAAVEPKSEMGFGGKVKAPDHE
ncbi:hypothetical protein QFZ60_001551 [Arthrobacter sp. B2I5]|uniref:hypothetical protein n=1 Tax=Arthrobacter sp. B2I5 TaxID=3042266 RepID=UPI0027864A8D|nr:hypothetical protein [Arthrobacter sp. B2I5]MDQ0825378.1 hypothetical protein [Arthrobacter sp. B2I5]